MCIYYKKIQLWNRCHEFENPIDSIEIKLNSPEEKAIKDLLGFLEQWETFAKQNGYPFLSESTLFGLKVTLKAALEITSFLLMDCIFSYLMTGRLNQDSLEL